MWVSRTARALCFTACRRSASFFELYGRSPEPQDERRVKSGEGEAPALSCSTTKEDDKDWERCRSGLQRFQAQVYLDPNHVPAELSRHTLASIATALARSPQRRSVAAQKLWKDALELRAHTPVLDVGAAADTSAILLLSERADEGYEAALALLHNNRDFCKHLVTPPPAGVEDALRFLSVFVMCAAADGKGDIPAEVLPTLRAALHHAKSTIASADKSKRSGPAHAVEMLAWSLDWLYGGAAAAAKEGAAAAMLAQLRPLFPQWLLFLFEPFDPAAAAASSSAFSLLSPRWLWVMAQRAGDAGDHEGVERLLRHTQRKEMATPCYCVFQLSTRVADILVRCFPHSPSSAAAVTAYGSALHRDALRHFGSTKEGFSKILHVLTTMSGAEPYFAWRSLLRHQSAEVAATTQEAGGDVLTGNPQLNWATALRFTLHEVEIGNPHWRMYLPETLRLLSDAGKSRPFWNLLQEYNAKDGATNLSVAASLAQMMHRTGKWWHAMEVVDLVAVAPPPRSTVEESFLGSACTDTLRVLLHCRRWQEALEVLTLMGEVVPTHEATVVSQLLTTLPSGAPWASALQLAKDKGFAVQHAETLLRVLHDGAASPSQLTSISHRVALPLFVQHGRWDLLCPLVEHNSGDPQLWRGLLQALERCPDVVDEAVGAFLVSSQPPALSQDVRVFSAIAQLCLHHGWYATLTSYLQTPVAASSSSSSTHATLSNLAKEYQYLLQYIQTGTRPPRTFVFTDSYVVHRLVACVAALQVSVVARLPREAAVSKRHATAYLRVPHENLGALRHDPSDCTAASIKVYSTAESAFLREHVLYCSSDGILFGYKVPGASLFACARGMLQTLQLSGVYTLAYNMSAASSGVFVLHPTVTSLRNRVLALHVRLCLACLADAPFVPLLATSFFKSYRMVWHGGRTEWHEVEAVVVAENGLDVKAALRMLKRDINAEGWGLVETERGAGDLYHIPHVRYVPRLSDGQPCDVQVITCGPRSLQPISGDIDTVSWMHEA
jgi:hypothetical protein